MSEIEELKREIEQLQDKINSIIEMQPVLAGFIDANTEMINAVSDDLEDFRRKSNKSIGRLQHQAVVSRQLAGSSLK